MNNFEMRVARTVRAYAMLGQGDSVVAGVSGGADSVALLYCLTRLAPRWKLTITAAHLNHHTRGAESDGDEQFVHRLGERLGVRVVSETEDVPALAASSGRNLEEFARETRYRFLRRVADAAGAGKIAVGHTLDDQAETVLIRLLRGSGTRGLAGIYPVVGGSVVRPLIDVTRRQVLDYLDRARLDFREDSSNRNPELLRNRVRHRLLPALRAGFNPRVNQALARHARVAREVSDYLESAAAEALGNLRLPFEAGVSLRRTALLELHPALQDEVVRLAVREFRGSLRGITATHVGDILKIARGESGRSADVGSGMVAAREFDAVLLSRQPAAAESARYEYELAWPGACAVPEAGVRLTALVQDIESKQLPAMSAAVEIEDLPRALVVRNRRPGDCYGGPGHRKVKKLLIDARVPRHSRDLLPLVVAGSAVVWMPGFPPAKSFRVRPGSRRCVILGCEALGNADSMET